MFDKNVLVGGLFLVALMILLALWEKVFTPGQMMGRVPFPQSVLPWVGHGGAWGPIPLTFVLAWIVARHPGEWTVEQWTIAVIIGFVASAGMHWMYCKAVRIPEVYVHAWGELTAAGWVHFVFMAGAIAILILEYIWTISPSRMELGTLSVFLTIYIAVGNHFVLGAIRPEWYQEKPLESPIGWATVGGVAVLLTAVTLIRGT